MLLVVGIRAGLFATLGLVAALGIHQHNTTGHPSKPHPRYVMAAAGHAAKVGGTKLSIGTVSTTDDHRLIVELKGTGSGKPVDVARLRGFGTFLRVGKARIKPAPDQAIAAGKSGSIQLAFNVTDDQARQLSAPDANVPSPVVAVDTGRQIGALQLAPTS